MRIVRNGKPVRFLFVFPGAFGIIKTISGGGFHEGMERKRQKAQACRSHCGDCMRRACGCFGVPVSFFSVTERRGRRNGGNTTGRNENVRPVRHCRCGRRGLWPCRGPCRRGTREGGGGAAENCGAGEEPPRRQKAAYDGERTLQPDEPSRRTGAVPRRRTGRRGNSAPLFARARRRHVPGARPALPRAGGGPRLPLQPAGVQRSQRAAVWA